MALTYEPIATTTLGSNQATVTFSSIPATYTDLVLVCNFTMTSTGQLIHMQFNSDTATNYSITTIYGDGTSAVSSRTSNATIMYAAYYGSAQSNSIVNIMNYANTTTYKTVLVRHNTDTYVMARAQLWRKTPEAINTITLTASSGNIASGSTFTLYGIKAA